MAIGMGLQGTGSAALRKRLLGGLHARTLSQQLEIPGLAATFLAKKSSGL